jgi:hypothetical protein
MKNSSGIKDQEDKSSGIEILITETFTKIKPTEPLRLAKEAVEGNEVDPIPPVVHQSGPMFHGEHAKIVDG